MRAMTLTPSRLTPPTWERRSPTSPAEEELWLQKEDQTSAWGVLALTGAALALLLALAVIG